MMEPPRQQFGLPRDRRGLESLELLDDRRQGGVAAKLGAGRHVLPPEQEPHEVLRRGGLYGLAPGPPGVAVHAGQEAAGHPLGPDGAGTVTALEREPLVLQSGEGDGHATRAQRRGRRQRLDCGDAAQLEVAAHHPGGGGIIRATQGQVGLETAFCGAPQLHALAVDRLHAVPGQQGCPQVGPLKPRRRHDQRGQQVVQVVRRSRLGEDLGVHRVDGLGVEGADGGQVDIEAATQPDGVGPPVLELLVVQEGVGPGGDDLVGEDRGLGGLGAVDRHLPALDPLQKVLDPVDVESLVQGVIKRLADEEVVRDLDGAGGVVLARRRLRKHGREQIV